MEKILNWKEKEARAKEMTVEQLEYAINDCVECVKCGVDEGYYCDEASVYRAELKKRELKKAKKKKYKFYSDAGHGWLSVPKAELVKNGLENEISGYSYMKGGTAYLEEDCDCPLFMKALGLMNEDIEDKYVDGQSRIRNYESYKA